VPCGALEDSFFSIGEVFWEVICDEFRGRAVTEKVAKFGGTFCGSGPSGGGGGGGRETIWITSSERAKDAEGTGTVGRGRMETGGVRWTRELCRTEDKTMFSGWMVWGGMTDGHEFGLCERFALDWGDETGQ